MTLKERATADRTAAREAARDWVDAADLTPSARLTGLAIADHAAVHVRPTTWRHIDVGDLAAFISGETIRKKRGGRRRINVRTIRVHIEELVDAGLERRRTARTNTYVFPHGPMATNTPATTEQRFRARLAALGGRPPDQAIAREAFAIAAGEIETWRHGERMITTSTLRAVYSALYMRSLHGRAPTTADELARDSGFSKRDVMDSLHVMRVDIGLIVRRPTIYEIRPGGMNWRMARHLADGSEWATATTEPFATTR